MWRVLSWSLNLVNVQSVVLNGNYLNILLGVLGPVFGIKKRGSFS